MAAPQPPCWITGNYRAIQRFYADDRIWTDTDTWHAYVDKRIGALLRSVWGSLSPVPKRVLNIGSGGNAYGVAQGRQIHIDLVRHRLVGTVGVVASAEALPLRSSTVDLVLCVGSVINHGAANTMIEEIGRVLRPGGVAVIEWDSLDGLHRLGSNLKAGAHLVDTFFNGRMFIMAEYSRTYVERAIASVGLVVEQRHAFHIVSGLLLGLGVVPGVAAHFIQLDPIFGRLPFLRYRGCNILLVARRDGARSVERLDLAKSVAEREL